MWISNLARELNSASIWKKNRAFIIIIIIIIIISWKNFYILIAEIFLMFFFGDLWAD